MIKKSTEKNNASIEMLMRNAGKRVLMGTLSLSLVASLVPVRPVNAYADDPVPDVMEEPVSEPVPGAAGDPTEAEDGTTTGGPVSEPVPGAAGDPTEAEDGTTTGGPVSEPVPGTAGDPTEAEDGITTEETSETRSESSDDTVEGELEGSNSEGKASNAKKSSSNETDVVLTAQQDEEGQNTPKVKVTREVEGETQEVEPDPTDSSATKTTDYTNVKELAILVTDQDENLSVDENDSYIEVEHTSFDSSEADSPKSKTTFNQSADKLQEYKATVELEEGTNVVTIVAKDEDGNTAEAWTRTIVLDTAAPEVTSCSFDSTAAAGQYRKRSLTVNIKDDSQIDTDHTKLLVTVDAEENPREITPEFTISGKTATGVISFTEAGTYSDIVIETSDGINTKTYNLSEEAFIINPQPVINDATWPTGVSLVPTMEISITDESGDFDPANTTVGGITQSNDRLSNWTTSDNKTWTATYTFVPGWTYEVEVIAYDGLGSVTRIFTGSAAGDQTAPTFAEATISRSYANIIGADNEDGALIVYGSIEATEEVPEPDNTVTITIGVSDNLLLDTVRVLPNQDGQEQNYSCIISDSNDGKGGKTVQIKLENDGNTIDRDIYIIAKDKAGNTSVWCINKDFTTTVDGEEVSSGNNSLFEVLNQTNPYALTLDLKDPEINITGIDTEGDDGDSVYSEPVTVTVTVNESNFNLLKKYYPNRAVFNIYKKNDSGTYELYKSVRAQEFDESSFDCLLNADGEYKVSSSFRDIADRLVIPTSVEFAINTSNPKGDITVRSAQGMIADGSVHNIDSAVVSFAVRDKNLSTKKTSVAVTGKAPNGDAITLGDIRGTWNKSGEGETTQYIFVPEDMDMLTFAEEGTYTVELKPVGKGKTKKDKDQARIGDPETFTFTIDRTQPYMFIEWDNHGDEGAPHNGNYYQKERTATITVVEANWDEDGFEDVVATATGRSNANLDLINVSSGWSLLKDTYNGDIEALKGVKQYQGTLTFTVDADYDAMNISGRDKAGNVATTKLDLVESLHIDAFTIDTETPKTSISDPKSTNPDLTLAPKTDNAIGTTYYNVPISLDVTIQDRNLDTGDTTIEANGGTISNTNKLKPSSDTDDCEVTWTATIEYGEGSYVAPTVHAEDLADNFNDYPDDSQPKKQLVVDFTAPTVNKVTVNHEPTYTGQDKTGEREFYKPATTVTIDVSDNFRIASGEATSFTDEDGEYTKKVTISKDGKTGSVTVPLIDGTDSKNDTEFDRKVILKLTDFAGNTRTWSIDKNGKVQDYKGSSTENSSINGQGTYPLALIHDKTSPRASLSGVTAGTYYNSDQSVSASINEFNFGYLKKYEGERAVLHVQKQEGNAGRATTTYDIPASSFHGNGENWSFTEALNSDGHYVVWIDFLDIADNQSEKPRIEEFTIDKTAPVMTVTFDNNDVHNGKYYSAGRNATITVTEHNFDSSLFTIDTNGSIGGWSSNGDTHTCIVSFGEDGTYNLAISGRDLASNEAVPYTEPEFTVDTKAPTITFGGIGERLGMENVLEGMDLEEGEDFEEGVAYHGVIRDGDAYNGVVAPAITYEDEANYDTMGWAFELVGNKNGDVNKGDLPKEGYDYGVSEGSNAQTVTFQDFGATESEDGTTTYNVDVDDIYTIHATLKDLAENSAEAYITFSVNRFGSNYIVRILDDETGEQFAEDEEMLPQAPMVMVREINVSGVDSELGEHIVSKEYANTTTEIQQDVAGDAHTGEGYQLIVPREEERQNEYGWAEYVYSIRSANFGAGSGDESETGEGQGLYRVNVASEDSASNGNNTADYWSSDMKRASAAVKVGTAEFVLDQQGPMIDEVDLPGTFSIGDYEASFHVTDLLTSSTNPDEVSVVVDGVNLAADQVEDKGNGTYAFMIPKKSFAFRDVQITVSDYAGRSDQAGSKGSYVTSLAPEVLLVLAAAAGLTGGTIAYRRRKETVEPDAPTARS